MTNSRNAVELRGSAIRLQFELQVPRPHAEVWDFVKDLPRFGTIDPLHRCILVLGGRLEPGAELAIEHGLLGISFFRYGRILKWEEGRSYAFSDLSGRGFNTGFPHVFFIEVTPVEGANGPLTRLSVRVQGKWTARWVPKPVQRLWLRAISGAHQWLLQRAFKASNLWEVP